MCFAERGESRFKYSHLQFEFLLLSFLLSFFFSYCFLSVLPSLLLSISVSLFHFYSHYFSAHFLLSFFFPFSFPLFRLFSSWLFFHFYSFLPFVTVPLSFLPSFLQFLPHILPCPFPSLYNLFTFLCISALHFMYQCLTFMYQCLTFMYQCLTFMYQCLTFMYQCLTFMYQCLTFYVSVPHIHVSVPHIHVSVPNIHVWVPHIHPNGFMLFLNDSEKVWVLTNPPGCVNTRVAALSKSNTRRSVSTYPLNSVGLQYECFITADLLQQLTTVQFCGCQFHSGYI